MIIVDAMGETCPIPVIKTKKELREAKEPVKVLVDNEIATQNLSKMAKQMGLSCRVTKRNSQFFEVLINEELSDTNVKLGESTNQSEYVVVVDTEVMGRGDEKLGKVLLKSFIYAYTEQDILPKFFLFYNRGAKLTVKDSSVLEDLTCLKEKGVEIYTCGACLDYFDLTNELKIGEITNMYRIVEIMSSYRVVKP